MTSGEGDYRQAETTEASPKQEAEILRVVDQERSLLQDAQAKEEDARLERLLLEGLASRRLPLDEGFWKRLEANDPA